MNGFLDSKPPLPNFVIIGAMKSGTTTLRRLLNDHPDAFCPKEIHFFTSNFDRGIDWYRDHFAQADGLTAIGEKCPDYMSKPVAMKRLERTLPDAKLIAILRNPVDRAYSNYWHERRLKRETLSFAEAVTKEPERPRRPGEEDLWFEYVGRSRYLHQLELVGELFPRDHLKILLFEDLRRDPVGTFQEACRFLGIDATLEPAFPERRSNAYHKPRAEPLFNFMQRKELWRRLPRPVAQRLFKFMHGTTEYPAMEPTIRRRLLDVFSEENAALARWLGRDLSVWSS